MTSIVVLQLLAISRVIAFDAQWARATSSAGRYSVFLPKPFHETVGDDAAWSRGVVHSGTENSFYLGGTPTPGINFLAAKLVYRSVDDARAAFDRMTLRQPPGYKRVYKKECVAAGLPGIESKVTSPNFVGYLRDLLSGDTVYAMTVEAPLTRDKEVEPAVRKFFGSLELLGFDEIHSRAHRMGETEEGKAYEKRFSVSILAPMESALQNCAERTKPPHVVDLVFFIDANGTVQRIVPAPGQPVSACLSRRLKTVKLPKPPKSGWLVAVKMTVGG